MDLSNKIMIGYCIMAVGGLFFYHYIINDNILTIDS